MLLQIRNIYKNFNRKKVLENINFNVDQGEIHGLVGKNGAGKSTTVNIISGVIHADQGEIIFDNQDISKLSVLERQNIGIYVIPQHAAVIPEFSVAENLFLGVWPKTKFGMVHWDQMYTKTKEELKEYGLDIDPKRKVKDLSLVNQRKLNIVRALYSKAKLIILDEPTTALSSEERNSLFEFIFNLKNQGTSFIFISHYLEEILKLSDTVTVIRDGQSFTGYKKLSVDEKTLSNLIVGEEVELCVRDLGKRPSNEIVLECIGATGPELRGVSFRLHRGEIVGLIGFPGSGAREICRAFYGLHKLEDGELKLNGKATNAPRHPEDALSKNIVYVSYDRHKEGIVPVLSIQENMSLSILKTKLKKFMGVLDQKKEKENALDYFSKLNIKAISVAEWVGNLSGGNQQKVVISKALSADPEVLIIDEPTVGIDVKSREEILSIINELTETGLGVLYLTNDYGELLRVADRLIFFSDGKVVREEINEGLSVEEVIAMRDSVGDDVA
jgi:simple sugar transport system ATP-binding protein